MTSKEIKKHLLKYFRFKRQMICGTEVHTYGGIADVLAISEDKKKSIEVEIKISVSDFRKEFKEKKNKHQHSWEYKTMPNLFYFAFPEGLIEKIINEVPKEYGIYEIDEFGNVKSIRKGRRLNKTENETNFRLLVKRINSELISCYEKDVQ